MPAKLPSTDPRHVHKAKVQAASKWIIYGTATHWAAWDATNRVKKELCPYVGGILGGGFVEAVAEFDKQIGPYYESRNKH